MQDVMPTLLQLAGAEHPGGEFIHRPVLPMRGKSFLSHLQDDGAPVHGADEAIGWELRRSAGTRARGLEIVVGVQPGRGFPVGIVRHGGRSLRAQRRRVAKSGCDR